MRSFSRSDHIVYQDPDEIVRVLKNCPICKSRKKDRKTGEMVSVEWINAPVSYDTETTSFEQDGEKRATVWLWGFAADGQTWYGRTWDEFDSLIERMIADLDLETGKKQMIVYVHNLSFDFGFLQYRYDWDDVFALDMHKVLYATYHGIVFRCSYLLTGYSLAGIDKNMLTKYHCEKLVGDLDYKLMRHSETPVTDKDLAYLHNDLMVIQCLIREKIEDEKRICWIPLTKTGYVRRRIRKACTAGGYNWKRNRELMSRLTMTPEEYKLAKAAFSGGFVHANLYNSLKTFEHVGSFDFCSSYPAVMVSEMFPMSTGERVDFSRIKPEDRGRIFDRYNELYCTIFEIEFINFRSVSDVDSILSGSKCSILIKPVLDNGRIVSADRVVTVMTNIDYSYIKTFYTWDKKSISTFYAYRKNYLPTPFIKTVIELFHDKTKLKDVAGSEAKYIRSKEDLNSSYGMEVTDPCRGVVRFDRKNGWREPERLDINKAIDKYNKSYKRVDWYLWGIFITSYARRNILRMIYQAGPDHIYSDTDSDKILHPEQHQPFIDRYNRMIEQKIERALRYHGLPSDSCRVENNDGVVKSLGTFELEKIYKRFKTLGAKRYMYEDNKGLHITVAGVSKTEGLKYLKKQKDPFKAFDDGLQIPAGFSGKNVHTYIDEPMDGVLIDYTGRPGEYHEMSGVHLDESDYNLSIGPYREFIEWIMSIKTDTEL